MNGQRISPWVERRLSASALVMVSVLCVAHYWTSTTSGNGDIGSSQSKARPAPWTDAQTVKPADLAKELEERKDADKPVVVCTGVRVLFEGAHVPGAVYHGPAVKLEGIEDLEKWAEAIPRSSSVVVYCGCCPFEHCPNVRPAFEALRAMGFQHLRVLVLQNNFAKDWVERGYPYEKGKGINHVQ